jgi:hypothetical protein
MSRHCGDCMTATQHRHRVRRTHAHTQWSPVECSRAHHALACSLVLTASAPYSELLTGLLADAFLQDSTRTTGGATPKSATLLALKFAVLRNLGALRANAGDERGNGDALDAYCQAVAIDSTDLLLWCVCATRVCLSTQARLRGGAC